MKPIKLLRITTVPMSMRLLLTGQPAFMRSRGMEVVLVSADGPDWDAIPDVDTYPVYKIDMARAIDLGRDARALWALIRLFRKVRPDIVHSHTPKAGLLAMLAGWLTGVPVRMHTVAGLPLMEAKGFKRWVLEWAERLTYRCATGVYPNSIRLKTFIEAEGFTRSSKLKVIAGGSSNGIDTEYFAPSAALRLQGAGIRESWGIPATDLVYIFIGRIVRDKGINELVEAFAAMPEKDRWLVLVGPYEDELDPVSAATLRLIHEHPRIKSAGYARDVRPYLCASDVMVFPSYREGFPNVPMQAGCFSLPCIVSDINGCNEIVEAEINGLIVPVKDAGSLGIAMDRMAGDPELRTRCSAAARPMIETRYRQTAVWEALFREYNDNVVH